MRIFGLDRGHPNTVDRHSPAANPEIRTVKTAVFDPVRDYGGYGVRSADDEKAWIASGNQGVRLELTNGGRLLIGSRQPKELEMAIRRLCAPARRALRR